VVLEEDAVAELLEYTSYIGFGALAVEEGRSFMRLGERVTGEAIDIWDDGNDPSLEPHRTREARADGAGCRSARAACYPLAT